MALEQSQSSHKTRVQDVNLDLSLWGLPFLGSYRTPVKYICFLIFKCAEVGD